MVATAFLILTSPRQPRRIRTADAERAPTAAQFSNVELREPIELVRHSNPHARHRRATRTNARPARSAGSHCSKFDAEPMSRASSATVTLRRTGNSPSFPVARLSSPPRSRRPARVR